MGIIQNIGDPGVVITGCLDPLATNYNPSATQPCLGNICCTYAGSTGLPTGGLTQTFGCLDPLASNYNPNAPNACIDCCTYQSTTSSTTPGQGVLSGPIGVTTDPTGPIGLPTGGGTGGGTVTGSTITTGTTQTQCPEAICITCDQFDWWNDTYILNHEGQSLSVTSPILWQQILSSVINSGQTISVNSSNGEPTTQECCQGIFRNGVCICQQLPLEPYTGNCVSNLSDFMTLISTQEGYNFFINNFSTIGPALGLTNQQTNFIKLNINNSNDTNNNGISDLIEARLQLSNALNSTGGFYVNFGLITNTPASVSRSECVAYGGYWSSFGTCMCKPVVDQCEIDLTQVQVVNTFDFFNNPIRIVTSINTPPTLLSGQTITISEECCNRLINDNPSLGWVWQSPYCLASPRENCLPVNFSLNEEIMEIPPCGNNLELSMWVYFAKPENPCQPIPDPADNNDVIIVDGQFCDVTLTPNTAAIIPTPTSSIPTNREFGGVITIGTGTVGDGTGSGSVVDQTPTCCYNINNPIKARITLTDTTLNQTLIQIKEYNSVTDYFDRWVQIKAQLPSFGTNLNFGIKLEIYQGLNCCCNYDFYIDDIEVNCPRLESLLVTNNIKCPGFKLNKVIDNKKSWVYNPGLPGVGDSIFDNIERQDGSFSMINGEGTINRTFAPSLDADIPWRYTDYWKQSSVYENHSNLVLNSKELWLTFDMCAKCPISGTTFVCPDGFVLSANTNVCYAEIIEKLFQDGEEFIFMDGENYIFQ